MPSSNVIQFPVRQIGGERPKHGADDRLVKRITCAMDAVLLAGAVSLFAVFFLKINAPVEHPLMGSYSTEKGQHACWQLPDQSELCLNTHSAARYTYSRQARNLELLYGEAAVTVQKDSRPLELLSGSLLTRDVSTAFNVYRNGGLSVMTVVAGSVKARVADQQTHRQFELAQPESGWDTVTKFHQLQQVELDESTGTLRERPALTATELSQLLSWKRGMISTQGKSLNQLLEEFSRYQPIEHFNISDPELAQLRNFKGDVDATDLMGFLKALGTVYGIQNTLSRGPDGETVVNLSRGPNFKGRSKGK
jgi:ferric-dicitrate binding protein FerR (iron transport regulator)